MAAAAGRSTRGCYVWGRHHECRKRPAGGAAVCVRRVRSGLAARAVQCVNPPRCLPHAHNHTRTRLSLALSVLLPKPTTPSPVPSPSGLEDLDRLDESFVGHLKMHLPKSAWRPKLWCAAQGASE